MIPRSISHVPQHLGEVPTTTEAKNCNSMGPRDFLSHVAMAQKLKKCLTPEWDG